MWYLTSKHVSIRNGCDVSNNTRGQHLQSWQGGYGSKPKIQYFFERKSICQLLWDSAGVWAFDPYPSSICSSWMYVTLKFPGLQLHQGTRGLPTSPSLKWFSQVSEISIVPKHIWHHLFFHCFFKSMYHLVI